MTCEERRDLLMMEALGGVSPEESGALRAHIATGCPACAGSAAEGSAMAAQFAFEIPPQTPNPALLDRLMAQVHATEQRDGASAGQTLAPNRFRILPSVASAAAAAVLAAAITAGIMWSQLKDDRLLKTPDLRYVSLAGSNPQPKARGRIFWDADRGYWHVYVFDLAPPPSGKTYELWFIGNDGRKTRAGLFDVSAKGDANLVVQVPPNLGQLAAAAVTDENAGGAEQPTGTIQLLGKIE